MVLTEKEKNGALKILRLLSETEVVSLAKTVTKSQIIIGTREGKSERAARLSVCKKFRALSISFIASILLVP